MFPIKFIYGKAIVYINLFKVCPPVRTYCHAFSANILMIQLQDRPRTLYKLISCCFNKESVVAKQCSCPLLKCLAWFLQSILVYIWILLGVEKQILAYQASVNKTCCKNTAFCHCNVRWLIAATHMMFQYSHAASERNKCDKIAAAWFKVNWEHRFRLQTLAVAFI